VALLNAARAGRPASIESAQAIVAVVREILARVRGLLRRLHSETLDTLGLAEAVCELAGAWQARHPGVACEIDIDAGLDRLPAAVEVTAYRLVQRDAWIDGFTDTTWHLGGTNYKGWSLGGSIGLDRNFWLSGRWTSTRNLDDGVRFLAVPGDASSLSGNLSSAPLRIEVFQLDLNARF